jgi:hypothetical protein
MRDIFTLQLLDDPGREHVLPAQLGGKLKSTKLVQKSTNNTIGSKLESAITENLRMFLNALGMTSRRGKTVGYDLTSPDSEFTLTSGFKPAPRQIGMTESFVDGKRLLTITARTTEEARQLIEGAKRRYPDLDLASAKPVRKRQYVDEPIQHRLSIGGPLFLRAIAKIAFEGFALAAGNAVACGKSFDDLRRNRPTEDVLMGCARARQSGGHGQERGNAPILDGRGQSIRKSRPATEGVCSQ